MDEKIEEIIRQYPITVNNKRRIRGATLLEGQDGIYTLVNYKESENKLIFQESVKQHLIEQGYRNVDQAIKNQRGEYMTHDRAGNHWIVKKWFLARECNLRDAQDVQEATQHLARLHNMMCNITEEYIDNMYQKLTYEKKQRAINSTQLQQKRTHASQENLLLAAETKNEDIQNENIEKTNQNHKIIESIEKTKQNFEIEESIEKTNQDSDKENVSADTKEDINARKIIHKKEYEYKNNVLETIERHMKEMRRVYNYIRSKHRKNDMEICILNSYPQFFEQAQEAKEAMGQINGKEIYQMSKEQGKVFHGSYNYHNILFAEQGIVTTNFEKAEWGLQIIDLYDYLRKILEKNNWNSRQGIQILEEYQKIHTLSKSEAKILYVMLLFPEKYWKQINFYYNSKKSWMSLKNYDKLLKINKQETDRKKFLEEAKPLLF